MHWKTCGKRYLLSDAAAMIAVSFRKAPVKHPLLINVLIRPPVLRMPRSMSIQVMAYNNTLTVSTPRICTKQTNVLLNFNIDTSSDASTWNATGQQTKGGNVRETENAFDKSTFNCLCWRGKRIVHTLGHVNNKQTNRIETFNVWTVFVSTKRRWSSLATVSAE